jgi:hypothetical protein
MLENGEKFTDFDVEKQQIPDLRPRSNAGITNRPWLAYRLPSDLLPARAGQST